MATVSGNWYAVAYASGRFVAVGSNGQITTSTDGGTSWSSQTVGSNIWYGVAIKQIQ